jgi:hypothetical protein
VCVPVLVRAPLFVLWHVPARERLLVPVVSAAGRQILATSRRIFFAPSRCLSACCCCLLCDAPRFYYESLVPAYCFLPLTASTRNSFPVALSAFVATLLLPHSNEHSPMVRVREIHAIPKCNFASKFFEASPPLSNNGEEVHNCVTTE